MIHVECFSKYPLVWFAFVMVMILDLQLNASALGGLIIVLFRNYSSGVQLSVSNEPEAKGI